MPTSLAIGDFSRATHLTVKTLRHYHESGLLEPAEVDPRTGYRRYSTGQIGVAQIIRRFRELDMPLAEIRAVLAAPSMPARNELIAEHLRRLEGDLSRTQSAVASLRDLLGDSPPVAGIGRRTVGESAGLAISEVVGIGDVGPWFTGALAELYAAVTAQGLHAAGPAGGMYANALFSQARGECTVFVPCAGTARVMGRAAPIAIPAVELATLVHEGSHANIDLAYGALATYVARHVLAVEEPLREYYLVGAYDTSDQAAWRTELGWPVFQTA